MALTWLRNKIRSLLVEFGGTISVPFDSDQFPIAIGNELLGSAHAYETLESLAEDLPKMRMQRGMLATVLTHSRPDGSVFQRNTFVLDPTDEIWDPFDTDASLEYISDIVDYDLSLFWKPFDIKASQNANNVIESQYADSQDYGRVGDPGQPAFQPPLISAENYQAGKKSDVDSSIIWTDTYNPTIHKYERQRLGATGNWGIPKLINTTSYSLGDYVDNRFIWVDKDEVPTRPPSILGGVSNGEPAGWSNTPAVPGGADYYDYIATHDLYRTSASKDTFGSLKSEWSTPVKISTDPNLVRYGHNPSSTDFIGVGGTDTADWRGFYTPGTDTHMATRINSESPWRIQNIDNEEGEYVDYIFKAFPESYEPIADDRPTISNPFSELEADYPNNGWKDYPFQVEEDETLFRSVGRKYNNGTLKPSGWSIPTRADGKDIIQVVIEPVGDALFKYNGAGAVSPATIVLKAKLYRGNAEVTADVNFKWYKGVVHVDNEIIKDSIVGVSANHVISGTLNDTLTISPEAVDGNQVYTLVGVFSDEDYQDNISILDVTDGVGIIAVIDSDDGYVYKNSAGSKIFTGRLFSNGVEIATPSLSFQWFLGEDELVNTDPDLTVDASDFTDKESLKVVITYDGEEYVRTESLVDLSDAPATQVQYSTQNPLPPLEVDQVWTTDPTGAYYMRLSTDGGSTWGSPIRVRGENAPFNGGFQRSAYKNASGQPTAAGLTSNLLPTGSGWTAQPTEPGVGESTWEVTAFFTKNTSTSDTALTDANWNIDGSWSVAIKKTGTDGDMEGPQGDPGPVGWSPEVAVVTDGAREVLMVVDWINLGGADLGTKPSTGYFIGAAGFTTDIASAKNVKGSPGSDANSRPMYYNTIGTKRTTSPTTILASPGTAIYASGTLQVTNLWSQSRYFRICGELPVANDNNGDGWIVKLLQSSINSWPGSPNSATVKDTNFSLQDFVLTSAGSGVHKIKVDTTVLINAGSSLYFRLSVQQNLGGNSKYEQGFIEAIGL